MASASQKAELNGRPVSGVGNFSEVAHPTARVSNQKINGVFKCGWFAVALISLLLAASARMLAQTPKDPHRLVGLQCIYVAYILWLRGYL
jgi:hypothetical protein